MRETAEYKREIGIAGAIAVIAALGVGLFAYTAFPVGPPGVLLGYVSATNAICSLQTGTCMMTLLNNSTVPLTVEGCYISPVISINGTVTTWSSFNGTAGGPALAGIPAASNHVHGSEVTGSCTISTSDLLHAPKGSFVSGGFMVKLGGSWYNYPLGTRAGISFEGYWS